MNCALGHGVTAASASTVASMYAKVNGTGNTTAWLRSYNRASYLHSLERSASGSGHGSWDNYGGAYGKPSPQAAAISAGVGLTVVSVGLAFIPIVDGADTVTVPAAAAEFSAAADAAADVSVTADVGATESELGDVAAACGGESFTAGTAVRLASGRAVAISALKVGDRVLATNPSTGKSEAKTVQRVWVNHDTDLMDLTVKAAAGATAVIHTTQHHPIWDDTTHTFVDADRLHVGDRLDDHGGATVTVLSTEVVPGSADMWDLTVDDDHDFYVATVTDVLVHNCPIGENGQQFPSLTVRSGKGWRMDAENPSPGVRDGQLHLQDYEGGKWQYDFETGEFTGVPRSLMRRIPSDELQKGIMKGLQYLGE